MRATTLAELRAHPRRMFATALAVILGVGFLTGTLILGDTAQVAFYNSFARPARDLDASVQAKTHPDGRVERYLSAAQAGTVATLPEVAAAQGRMVAALAMLGADGAPLTNFGDAGLVLSTDGNAALRAFDVSGTVPAGPDEALLDRDTAAHQKLAIGDPITVLASDGSRHRYRLTGLLDFGVSQEFAGRSVVGLPTREITALTGESGFTEIVATARAGVSEARLAGAIRAALGPGADVATGDQRRAALAERASKVADEFVMALSIFAVVSLIVAGFVIYNTFAILLAQRVRQTALRRCIGATRTQVFASVLIESTVVGLVGGVAGVLVGFAVALGLAALLNGLLNAGLPIGGLEVTATPIVAGLAVALLVTVGSALVPAVRATRTAPIAALRDLPGAPAVSRRRQLLRFVAGLVVAVPGVALTGVGVGHDDPQTGAFVVMAGGVVTFLALLLWLPLFIGPLTAVVAAVPARLVGVPGRLAVANARRNPGRTAITTATLMIAIGLLALSAVVLGSIQATADRRLASQFPADYVLTAVRYGEQGNATVPAGYAEALRGRAEVARVAEIRVGDLTVDGTRVRVAAVDPGGLGSLVRPAMTTGTLVDLRAGTVVLADDGRLTGSRGARLAAGVRGGSRPLTVVGTGDVSIPGTPRVDALLPWDEFTTLVGSRAPTVLLAKAAPGVSPTASRDALRALAATYPLVQIGSAAELANDVAAAVQGLVILFAGLLGTAVLISLFGVTNTLSLSVLERTRESATVRALGLTRGQLRGTLLTEALLMGAVGALVGIGYGLIYGRLLVGTLLSAIDATIVVPWVALGVLVLVAMAAAAVAAVLPARRAAKVSIVEAMAVT
ncbi:MAG TPA: FtsX-like permease family protein [Catenuloplanes sp.]